MTNREDEVEISDSGADNTDASESNGSLFSRSPSVEKEPGQERWRMSEPPQEIFEDGEWKFQIIGEEIDHNGEIKYEVEWEDWNRPDGSNTTWETAQTISDIQWRPAQQKLRNEMAARSLSVDVMTTTDIHNFDSFLRNQAYHEKLKRRSKEKKVNRFDEMAKLLAKHGVHDEPMTRGSATQASQGSSSSSLPLRKNQRASTQQQAENFLAGTSKSARSSSRLSSRSSTTLLQGHANSSANHRALSVASTSYSSTKPSSSMTLVDNILPAPKVPLKSTASLKGKEKEVFAYLSSPEYLASHDSASHNHIKSSSVISTSSSHVSTLSTSKKRPSHEYSDTENLPSLFSPSKNSRKRARRFIESSSEAEDRPHFVQDQDISLLLPPKVRPYTKNASTSSSSKEGVPNRRYKVQAVWTAAAQSAGAAPVYLVNEIDDEVLPDIDPHFRYIEKTYEFAPGIEKPPDDFLLRCSCKKCTKAIHCDCQQSSFMLDAKAIPFFAYKNGLFAFNVNKGIEVIECNKLCACAQKPNQCPNRVSQIPRKHPVEIFKTATRGWGVRSTKDIKKGQVLGIYTGLVITREDANALPAHLAKYRFDLDGDEPEDGQDNESELTHDLYSVDSRLHGNWTRFINHSCSPNLQIYLVVHDTPPGIGLPYIAFVASDMIPSREELTFDYNPGTTTIMENGANPCHCGSPKCRGFLF